MEPGIDPEKSAEEILWDKFPDMIPIKRPPPLFTFNGFGLGVYGKRNLDADTGTYVKTLCFCAIFIPFFALSAYRVADAPKGGWFFLGKERLSAFAKGWNLLLSLFFVGLIGHMQIDAYRKSDEYKMGRALDEAREIESSGKGDALPLFEKVAFSKTSYRKAACVEGREYLLNRFRSGSSSAKTELFLYMENRCKSKYWFMKPEEVIALAQKTHLENEKANPPLALTALRVLIRFEQTGYAEKELALLRAIVEKNPRDATHAVELALMLAKDEAKRSSCEAILNPIQDQLGSGEGARLLGQILVDKGEFKDACPFLKAYCTKRLEKMHELSKKHDKAYESTAKTALARLKNSCAPEAWYREYSAAPKAKQEDMVNDYITKAIRKNSNLTNIRKELSSMSDVIPAALDLGLIMLKNAEASSGTLRTEWLNNAEEVFLSIGGVASNSPQYQIQYGQVLCWLGRPEEGKEQFDKFIGACERNVAGLCLLSNVLRQVGQDSEARCLVEEAYEKEKDPQQKKNLAASRAAMSVDIDDRITWLEKADSEIPSTRCSLGHCRGIKAIREGRFDAAEIHLRKAISISDNFTETSTELNLRAIVCSSLFSISGEPQDLDEWLLCQEKSLALQASDTILLGNTAYAQFNKAQFDILREHINFKAVRCLPSDVGLDSLYSDEKEYNIIYGRLLAHPAYIKGIENIKTVQLLAPSDTNSLASLAGHFRFRKDDAALKKLLENARKTPLDCDANNAIQMDVYAGKRDNKTLEDLKNQLIKFNILLKKLPPYASSATRAYLLNAGYHACSALQNLGQSPVEIKEYIREGIKLYNAYPSTLTHSLKTSIVVNQIHQEICQKFHTYAKQASIAHFGSSPTAFLLFAAERNDKILSAIKASSQYSEWKRLQLASIDAYPSFVGSDEWAFCRLFEPALEPNLHRKFAANECGKLMIEINSLLHPLKLNNVFSSYWMAMHAKNKKKAQDILFTAIKQGVPIPEWK